MTDTPTPQQQLDTMATALRGPEPSATPSMPQEAQARLNHLTADKAWGERLLKGDAAIVREYKALTEQVASGGQALEFENELVDSLSDPHAMPKPRYDGMIETLREQGMVDTAAQYLRDLDSGVRADRPTAGDGAACRQALDRLMKDSTFAQKVLGGDARANALRIALGNVVALADADDGKPVSDQVRQYIAGLGF